MNSPKRELKISSIKKYDNWFLIILFLGLAFIAIYPFWHTGYLYSGSDMQFHLSRIQEWVEDVKQGGIFSHPIVATHTFNEIGDIVPDMYPWITLFPFVLFMLIMKPISAIYLGFILIIFVTLLLAYFSMYEITNSKRLSLYFSILYGFNTYIINQTLNFEMGTSLAYQFLPVAFAGLYMIMRGNYNKWYWLVIGLTGIMYSHVVFSILSIVAFGLIYIFYFIKQPHHTRWQRFFRIVLSGIITILLTISVWEPILVTLFTQKLSKPNKINLNNGNGNLYEILTSPFHNAGFDVQDNRALDCFGIFIILTVILGFIFLRKIPKSIHKYYYFGILSIVLLSKIFPWGIISKTRYLNNIDIIQKTSRMYPFCILMLSIYGAYVLNVICHYKVRNGIVTLIFILFNVLIVGSFAESGLYKNNIKPYVSESELPYKATITHQVPLIFNGGYKVNNSTFYNQFPEENETGMRDYIPMHDAKMNVFTDTSLRKAKLNGNDFYIQQRNVKPGANRISYYLNIPMKKNTTLELPFLKYRSLKYKVLFNGQIIKPQLTNNSTLKFNIPKRVSSIANISIKCSIPYHIWLVLITLITWIGLVGYIYWNKISKLLSNE